MLLTDARRAARTGPDGELVPLAEQDRTLWDHAADRRGRRARSRDALPRRRSARTSCRPRSPRCTTRRRAPRRPTGRRSSRCTSCWNAGRAEPDGHAQPGGRGGDGARSGGRAGAARGAGRRRAAGRASPARTPSARHLLEHAGRPGGARRSYELRPRGARRASPSGATCSPRRRHCTGRGRAWSVARRTAIRPSSVPVTYRWIAAMSGASRGRRRSTRRSARCPC